LIFTNSGTSPQQFVAETIKASGLGSQLISGDKSVTFFPPSGVAMAVESERLCPVEPWVAACVAAAAVTGIIGVTAADNGSRVPCCWLELQAARMRHESRINTEIGFIRIYSTY
jgi:hypothetical protein